MSHIECIRNLFADSDRFPNTQSFLLQSLTQCLTFEILQRQVRTTISLAYAVNGDDMGMAKLRCSFGFE